MSSKAAGKSLTASTNKGSILPLTRNARYRYTVEAWRDVFASWRIEVSKKHDAGVPVGLELIEGRKLLARTAEAASGEDAERLRGLLVRLEERLADHGWQLAVMLGEDLRELMSRVGLRVDISRYERELEVVVGRTAAAFGIRVIGASKTPLRDFYHVFLRVPWPVALAFIVGGVLILWIEARHKKLYGAMDLAGGRRARVETVDDMTVADALKVGLLQCLALVPGTSRSGATIMGALVLGFSRKAATEFSFFLGIPTLVGAGAYSVWKQRDLLSAADTPMFAVGTVVAFFSALLCIRWLIRYVSTHDFTAFAWYRIVFGGIVLLTASTGWVTWAA